MIVYISVFIWLFFFVYIYQLISSKQRTSKNEKILGVFCKYIAPIPLIFVTCFRYGVGYDFFPTYTSDYYLYKSGGDVHSDIGFNFLYSVSQFIGDDPQILFIITGFVSVICVYIAVIHFSPLALLSLIIYFVDDSYFRSISMISQFLSISLLLLCFLLLFSPNIIRNNRLIAYCLGICAALIHVSSLIVFVTIIFVDLLIKRISSAVFFYIALVCPLATIIFKKVFAQIINNIYLSTRFAGYQNSVFAGQTSKSIIFIEFAIFCIMFFCLVYTKSKSMYLNIAFLMESVALSFALLSDIIPLSYRITFYFAAFHIVTIPNFILSVKNIYIRKILIFSIVTFLATWFVLFPIANNYDSFLPYRFVFNKFIYFN